MSFADYLFEDARLVILKELAQETDATLNEKAVTRALETYGYKRSREWVRTQMRKLEELGAVRLTEAGTVLIARLTRPGLDHVERRSIIEGVAQPDLGN